MGLGMSHGHQAGPLWSLGKDSVFLSISWNSIRSRVAVQKSGPSELHDPFLYSLALGYAGRQHRRKAQDGAGLPPPSQAVQMTEG